MSIISFVRSAFGARPVRPALFLHLQKTAGTSIVVSARKHYGKRNVSSHGDFVGKDPMNLVDTPFVSGHFGFGFAEQLMNGRYSFTFLRDPVERVISHYYFCRTRDPSQYRIYQLAAQYDLAGFVAASKEEGLVGDHIWNIQARYLAGQEGSPKIGPGSLPGEELLRLAVLNSQRFSHVGFTETFDQDAKVICTALGFGRWARPGRANVTAGRPKAPDLPSGVVEMIKEITEIDQRLYETLWNSRKERDHEQGVEVHHQLYGAR